jgi:hypothetical protein
MISAERHALSHDGHSGDQRSRIVENDRAMPMRVPISASLVCLAGLGIRCDGEVWADPDVVDVG